MLVHLAWKRQGSAWNCLGLALFQHFVTVQMRQRSASVHAESHLLRASRKIRLLRSLGRCGNIARMFEDRSIKIRQIRVCTSHHFHFHCRQNDLYTKRPPGDFCRKLYVEHWVDLCTVDCRTLPRVLKAWGPNSALLVIGGQFQILAKSVVSRTIESQVQPGSTVQCLSTDVFLFPSFVPGKHIPQLVEEQFFCSLLMPPPLCPVSSAVLFPRARRVA